uniref:DNA-directed RNA polymerase subunit beta n=1 Tax=Lygus hesperus TaxID=30085 RepID=A0A0A9WUT6_LYGHE
MTSTVIDEETSNKVVLAWCAASDSDDGEMRLACVSVLAEVCVVPMTAGSANEVVQSILLRLDDSSTEIQLRSVVGLQRYLRRSAGSAVPTPLVKGEIMAQMVPLVRKILIYMDDEEGSVMLR